MEDNDNDNDNDNEGVEVETAYQHQNEIITIADNVSALNTKHKAAIARPFLPAASSYLSCEIDLINECYGSSQDTIKCIVFNFKVGQEISI